MPFWSVGLRYSFCLANWRIIKKILDNILDIYNELVEIISKENNSLTVSLRDYF